MKSIIKFILILLVLGCLVGSIFIIKALWQEHQIKESIEGASIKQRSFIQTLADNFLRPLLVNRIDFYLKESQALQHLYKEAFLDKMISKTDVILGKGEVVRCGQKVIVRVLDNPKGINFTLDNLPSTEYQIGASGDQILDIGLLDMRKGGIRILEISSSYLRDKAEIEPDKVIKKVVQLVDIKDTYSPNVEGLLAFSEGTSSTSAAMCGDKVDISYKIKTLPGKLLSSGNKQYILGSRQMPLAFELGLIGAQPAIKRYIITTGDLMTDIVTNPAILDLQLSRDEGVVIEVDLHGKL